MKVAVVGVTGMVGRKMIRVLEERRFPLTGLIPVASGRSAGKTMRYDGTGYRIKTIEEALEEKPRIALFSAGAKVSLQWAPVFAERQCTVIDNSSAWRMHENIPLVVPEINAGSIALGDRIIANPNCSTIQLVMVLAPLHKKYGIKRVVVSTYQSVTGTGKDAVRQLEDEEKGLSPDPVYPHPIYRNALPHCDVFLDNGYTKEEMKLVHETRKILQLPHLPVTATAVRIPVTGGHSESVNITFDSTPGIEEIRDILRHTEGVVVLDNPGKNEYPTPLQARESDQVYVGRIRTDESFPNTVNLWVVSDNLRKGAATNAVQIAEYLLEKKWI